MLIAHAEFMRRPTSIFVNKFAGEKKTRNTMYTIPLNCELLNEHGNFFESCLLFVSHDYGCSICFSFDIFFEWNSFDLLRNSSYGVPRKFVMSFEKGKVFHFRLFFSNQYEIDLILVIYYVLVAHLLVPREGLYPSRKYEVLYPSFR